MDTGMATARRRERGRDGGLNEERLDLVIEWQRNRKRPRTGALQTSVMDVSFMISETEHNGRTQWRLASDFGERQGYEHMGQLWARDEAEAVAEADRMIRGYWEDQLRISRQRIEDIEGQSIGRQRRLM